MNLDQPGGKVVASSGGTFVVEVLAGPSLQACLGVLDLVEEFIELVPEWNQLEIEELKAKQKSAMQTIIREIERSKCFQLAVQNHE